MGFTRRCPFIRDTKLSSPPESIDAALAKNLVAARVVGGFTQHELAKRSNISRATIAQIETGSSDPRLSTIACLAKAVGIPPIFLLAGLENVLAVADALQASEGENGFDQLTAKVPDEELNRMLWLFRSGMLKDRLRVAEMGAELARKMGGKKSAEVYAAIFSAILPGPGTVAGILLGQARDEREG